MLGLLFVPTRRFAEGNGYRALIAERSSPFLAYFFVFAAVYSGLRATVMALVLLLDA